jgi:uncharacterized protein with GYD domain
VKTYIILAKFTTKGRNAAKDITKRANEFWKLAKKFDVTVKEIFRTHGPYDVVVIAEAADEFSATALHLSLMDRGNVRTRTLRAFSQPHLVLENLDLAEAV